MKHKQNYTRITRASLLFSEENAINLIKWLRGVLVAVSSDLFSLNQCAFHNCDIRSVVTLFSETFCFLFDVLGLTLDVI